MEAMIFKVIHASSCNDDSTGFDHKNVDMFIKLLYVTRLEEKCNIDPCMFEQELLVDINNKLLNIKLI